MTHLHRDFELGGESRSKFLFYKPAVVKVMRQYDKYKQGSVEQLAFMRKCLEEVNVVYEVCLLMKLRPLGPLYDKIHCSNVFSNLNDSMLPN